MEWSEFLTTNPEVPGLISVLPDFLKVVSQQLGPIRLTRIAEEILESK
jgi:hypothetical protein